MQLNLRTFDTIVASGAAAVQGAASTVLDLAVGSVLRAVLEANAGLGLWLQWMLLQVLQTTRAATSSGGDLDTWVGDFAVSRLPASVAAGTVRFARFAPVTTALVPVGTRVRTSDGLQSFFVMPDSTNAAWNTTQNGYVLAAGIASVTVPVVAAVAGSAGNVQAGTISLVAAAAPGVDSVTNPSAIAGGLDAESDAALRARFAAYISSLSKATTLAVGYAVASVQQGLQYTIQENALPGGAWQAGCFVVTVDNGSGAPPAGLLAAVSNAVAAVRPLGSLWTVQAPVVTPAYVSMALAIATGTPRAPMLPIVAAAVSQYLNSQPVGAAVPWSRLAQVAYDASPTVINVTSVLLNGSTADVVPGPSGVVKAGGVLVA